MRVDDVVGNICQALLRGATDHARPSGEVAAGERAPEPRPGKAVQVVPMTKCVKVLGSKSKAKSMDQSRARIKPFQTVPTRIRACDWSMLFAFAFARNTLTHFVISNPR